MTAPDPGQASLPGVLRRFGFRFFAAYMLVYNAVSLLGLLPWIGRYSYYLDRGWNLVVLWTERVVLGMRTLSSLRVSGSGDTSFLWARTGCMLAISLIVALVWSCFDRARRRDHLARDFVRVCVRYRLAAVLIGYGFAKLVPPGQFPAPNGPRLLEPIGRLSPMGMLWVFMGASTAYKVFGGLMEIFGGTLLFLRRTTPLGSVVSFAVILNIVLLNFCYDVPVKLFSANLLLMAAYLAWPDLRRIANVLVLNRPAGAASLVPPWRSAYVRASALALKVLVIGSFLYGEFRWMRTSGPEFKPAPASVTELSGIWTVETYARDGAVVPPLITDDTRWRRVVIENDFGDLRLIALGEDGRWLGVWLVGPDSTEGKLELRSDPKDNPIAFGYTHPGPDKLEITGKLKNQPFVASLGRVDQTDNRLFTRGFHWISEVPFNR